ncbi:gamma-glutamylcyclotransferase family protein [Sagittula sp. S175]|uniref:gamma-glutamylcyclotransferase family protein n=1 Tax=Sagittula sp. S175 TaxID=3415129 RepID=UPI003C7BBE41
MTHMYFFGYGSLVNAATHAHTPLHKATAKGWRRAWVAVPERDLCYLSAVADPLSVLHGAIAPVPGNDWAALDLREAAYARHDQTEQIDHDSPARSIALYAVAPERHTDPGPDNPILLSYLDTVITGFLALHGPQGAMEFFASTSGWQAPILNDRVAPRYPRTTPLSEQVREMVDEGLAAQGSRILAT